MYFDNPEIIPPLVQGDFRFSKTNEHVARLENGYTYEDLTLNGHFLVFLSLCLAAIISEIIVKTYLRKVLKSLGDAKKLLSNAK